MKSHVIVGCFVLLQPFVLFAAQPIVDPEDTPRAAAPQTDPRTQRAVPKRSARVHDAKAAEKDPRRIVQPKGRKAHRGALRGLIDPEDQVRRIIEPADKVRGRIAPSKRPPTTEGAVDGQRGDSANPVGAGSAIEGGSFGAPSFAKGETTNGRRERWRALAEELALRLVGGCIASLAEPAEPIGEAADASGSKPAAQSGCPVLPLPRSER